MKMLFSGKNVKILLMFASQNCKCLQGIVGMLMHQIIDILQKEFSVIALILQSVI